MIATSRPGPSLLLRRLCLVLAAAVAFQLFYLGATPFAVGLIQPPWDKIAHFLVYSALALLIWIGTAGRTPLAVIAAVAIIGGLDELHQASLPGRAADAADFLVDVGAITCASVVMLLLDARSQPNQGEWKRPVKR